MARVSAAEPVRFRRPPEELALLVAGRNARSEPDLFRRVAFAGRDLAWINLSTFDARRSWKLWDYAGDREAVAAGLALLMRAERIESVTAHVPAWDVALNARLAAAGLRGKDDVLPWHTIKIPDFHRFMELFRPALAERVDSRTLAGLRFETRPGGGGVIRAGKQALTLKNPHDLVALMFGAPPARMPAAIRRAPEPVARFIKAALPPPLRFPGLNYV